MADEPTTADPWVEMTHPKLPDSPPAPALRSTFEQVWEPRGWELHKPTTDDGQAPADTVTVPLAPAADASTPDAASRRKTAATTAPKED
ncbi:hypothetical protein RM863_35290 [Streptomyces sp. DSM 41014]|uniref:Uncharacterized protein n=1 Tax=Streptomyces hintoniae TaxID=3075521 RepID=A0ABU2UWK2_9ACTN|nr:hypothetical protein [Streptomyces sp. DSM 41014]MDT0477400.1 hypothetical protein [Streptomyces sp. DSM 41014]